MSISAWLKERRDLKKIEFEAYKQERENIAFRKEEEKQRKFKERSLAARQRGREKAYTPLGTGIKLKAPKVKKPVMGIRGNIRRAASRYEKTYTAMENTGQKKQLFDSKPSSKKIKF